jgi:hypothetical protein
MVDAMDSKSITRKGVGVRVPSLVPPLPASPASPASPGATGSDRSQGPDPLREIGEELIRFLLPPLLDRLGEDRALLEEATLRLQRSSGGDPPGAELLAETDALLRQDRRLGWCFGVLAGALGADLLLVRREREGLRILAELLQRATGVSLVPSPAVLPELAPERGEGWELPLAVLYFFRKLECARGPADVLPWGLECGETDWIFSSPTSPAPPSSDEAWEALLAPIAGARILHDAGGLALAVPHSWFNSPRARR